MGKSMTYWLLSCGHLGGCIRCCPTAPKCKVDSCAGPTDMPSCHFQPRNPKHIQRVRIGTLDDSTVTTVAGSGTWSSNQDWSWTWSSNETKSDSNVARGPIGGPNTPPASRISSTDANISSLRFNNAEEEQKKEQQRKQLEAEQRKQLEVEEEKKKLAEEEQKKKLKKQKKKLKAKKTVLEEIMYQMEQLERSAKRTVKQVTKDEEKMLNM